MEPRVRILVGLFFAGVGVLSVLAYNTGGSLQNYDCGRAGPTPWSGPKLLWGEADNPGPSTSIPAGEDIATHYDAVSDVSSIMVSCNSSSGPICCVANFRLRVAGDHRNLGWKEQFLARDLSRGPDSLIKDPTWNDTQVKFGQEGLMTAHIYQIVSPYPYIGSMALGFGLLGGVLVFAWTKLRRQAIEAGCMVAAGTLLASTGITMGLVVWMGGIVWMPLAFIGLTIGAAFSQVPAKRAMLSAMAMFLLVTFVALLWLSYGFGIGLG